MFSHCYVLSILPRYKTLFIILIYLKYKYDDNYVIYSPCDGSSMEDWMCISTSIWRGSTSLCFSLVDVIGGSLTPRTP